MEKWKSIDGYEDFYEISDYGRVRSLDRLIQSHTKTGSVYYQTRKGRIIKASSGHRGHLQVHLSVNDVSTDLYVHRLVAAAFIPNPKNLSVVMHLDDDPTNNHKKNLKWGTYQDNSDDMYRKGRGALGSTTGNAKLTEKEVVQIRKLISQKLSNVEIAKRYAVGANAISGIRCGKAWKHLG